MRNGVSGQKLSMLPGNEKSRTSRKSQLLVSTTTKWLFVRLKNVSRSFGFPVQVRAPCTPCSIVLFSFYLYIFVFLLLSILPIIVFLRKNKGTHITRNLLLQLSKKKTKQCLPPKAPCRYKESPTQRNKSVLKPRPRILRMFITVANRGPPRDISTTRGVSSNT